MNIAIKTLKCAREAPVIAFARRYICTACGEMSNDKDSLCYPAEWQYKINTGQGDSG